jgi:hypothetical protein
MKSARADIAEGGLNPELQVTFPATWWSAAQVVARPSAF